MIYRENRMGDREKVMVSSGNFFCKTQMSNRRFHEFEMRPRVQVFLIL